MLKKNIFAFFFILMAMLALNVNSSVGALGIKNIGDIDREDVVGYGGMLNREGRTFGMRGNFVPLIIRGKWGSTAEKLINGHGGATVSDFMVSEELSKFVKAQDSDFVGERDGYFKYIGSDDYVEIPHVIKGVAVTSYMGMFGGTSVKGVKSTNKKVTDMGGMFGQSSAKSLDLSSFDTSNVTNMHGMFENSSATELDLSSFDTGNVTTMHGMFENSSATELDLSSFDTSKVTNMINMFQYSSAKELDLSNFDTSNVELMYYLFWGSSAKTIDVSNFDTRGIEDMSSMFRESAATHLDLSSFDTSSAVNMDDMFNGSSALWIDLSSFNTDRVWSMSGMFANSSVTELDLSSFDLSGVNSVYEIVKGSSATEGYARTQKDADKINGSSGKPDDLVFRWYELATDKDFSGDRDGEFRYVGSGEYVEIPLKIKGADVTSYNSMFKGTSVNGVKSENKNIQDMRYMFSESEAESLELSALDTSNVRNMGMMFSGDFGGEDSSLTYLDLRGFDTSKVTDMREMFMNTGDLVEIRGLDNFNTSKVTNMSSMFRDNSAKSLNLSSFDTSNVETMYWMFSNSSAESLDMSTFDTSGVTDMGSMFRNSSAKFLDLSSFDTSRVTHMGSMFLGSSVTALDLSNFDTSMVVDMSSMFRDAGSLKELEIRSFDTSKVTGMYNMFRGMGSLKELKIDNFDTRNVTSMGSMFRGAGILTELDLSNFDTSNVTTMGSMFSGAESLTELDLSNFDTGKLVDMNHMFKDTRSLKELSLSSFDTGKAIDTEGMFQNTGATVGWAWSHRDADTYNQSSGKPRGLEFNPVYKITKQGGGVYKKRHSTGVTIDPEGYSLSSAKYQWTSSVDYPLDGEWETFRNGQVITKEGSTGDYFLHLQIENSKGVVMRETTEVFQLDNTAPSLKLTPSTTKWTRESVVIEIDAEDLHSGVEEVFVLGENAVRNGDFSEGLKYWTGNGNEEIKFENGVVILADADKTRDKLNQLVFIDGIEDARHYVEVDARGEGILNARRGVDGGGYEDNSIELKGETKFKTYSFPVDRNKFTNGSLVIERLGTKGSIEIRDVKVFERKDITSRSLVVHRNGTYEFTAVDKAGNMTTKSIKVDNIDNTPPKEPIIGGSTLWKNVDQEISIVHGSDSGSGVDYTEYRLNGGSWKKYGGKLDIRENGETKIEARTVDKAGNESEVVSKVIKIDKEKPNLSLSKSPSGWTSGNVIITAEAEDKLSGVKNITYIGESMVKNGDFSEGEKYWNTKVGSGGITKIENGKAIFNDETHSLNKLSQKNTFEGSVLGVDYVAEITAKGEGVINARYGATGGGHPQVSYKQDLTGDRKYVFKMDRREDSTDSLIVERVGNGYMEVRDIKVFAQKEIKDNKLEVTQNGTYTFVVEDNAGNITTKEIDVGNIDKEAPKLSISKDGGEWAKSHITKVSASGGESGLAKVEYIWSNGSSSPKEGFKETADGESLSTPSNSGGNYLHIRAKDKAGNVAVLTSKVFKVDVDVPVIELEDNGGDWKKSHLVKLEVSDSYSRLNKVEYKWSTEKKYSSGGMEEVSRNSELSLANKTGEYYLHVRAEDNVGNVTEYVSKVFKIDSIKPEGSLVIEKPEKSYGAKLDLVGEKDEHSGLDDKPYSYAFSKNGEELGDFGKWTSEKPEYVDLSPNSKYVYKAKIRDKVGNELETNEVVYVSSPKVTYKLSEGDNSTLEFTFEREIGSNDGVAVEVKRSNTVVAIIKQGDKFIDSNLDYERSYDYTFTTVVEGTEVRSVPLEKKGVTTGVSSIELNLEADFDSINDRYVVFKPVMSEGTLLRGDMYYKQGGKVKLFYKSGDKELEESYILRPNDRTYFNIRLRDADKIGYDMSMRAELDDRELNSSKVIKVIVEDKILKVRKLGKN